MGPLLAVLIGAGIFSRWEADCPRSFLYMKLRSLTQEELGLLPNLKSEAMRFQAKTAIQFCSLTSEFFCNVAHADAALLNNFCVNAAKAKFFTHLRINELHRVGTKPGHEFLTTRMRKRRDFQYC
jgi:hypothetical protein